MRIFPVVTLFVCLLVGSVAKAQTPATHQRAAAPAGRPQAQLTDKQIEAAIKAKFAASKSAAAFTVHVQGGVATIEGKTDVVQRKSAATLMAKRAGAIAVKNNVLVSEAAKKKAASSLEEGRRRAQVKRGEPRSDK